MRPSPAEAEPLSAGGPEAVGGAEAPFWDQPLAELNEAEWEALCDGCGRCCLHKLEYEDTGELVFTRVACHLLDLDNCRCTRYATRRNAVPDCLDLRVGFTQFHWLPETCAYRLRHEGKPLPNWHPLVSGRAESVHEAGISVRPYAISEDCVEDVEDYLLEDFDFRGGRAGV